MASRKIQDWQTHSGMRVALWLLVTLILTGAHFQAKAEDVMVTPAAPTPGDKVTIHYSGRYAQKSNLTLRYGFNGWNRVDNMVDLQDIRSDGNFFKEVGMRKTDGTGFSATIDVPTTARALHFVFYWDNNGRKRWDNNGRREYRKAITLPYIGPYLTWNQNMRPDTGVVVNFQTSVMSTGSVEYGETEALGTKVIGCSPSHSHHIELTGLAADTIYYYRVLGEKAGPSPIYSFQTAPINSSQFSFAVMGDMQDKNMQDKKHDRRWHDVAKEISAKHGDIAFLVLVGDMPWNDEPGHWWTFFDKGRQLLATKVMMPVPGNHDTPSNVSNQDTRSFEELFDLPTTSGSETYYSFRFGSAKFLGLNSEVKKQFRDYEEGDQYDWALSELDSRAQDVEWLFVYWHIPPYNAGRRHSREQGHFRDITKLFDGKVDWVFAGHEHLYQRFKPIQYNAKVLDLVKYGTRADEGVGYMIVPPAGNMPEEMIVSATSSDVARYRKRLAYPVPEPGSSKVNSEIGFVIVAIDGKTINLKTFGMGTLDSARPSHLVDTVNYSK